MSRAKPWEKVARMLPLSAQVSATDMPEALALLRRELADCLRRAAETEPPEVASRLRAVAAVFETGQRGPSDGC